MEKCIFCGNEIASMIGYFADGDARVCSLCCSRYTLTTYINRVKSVGANVKTKDVFAPAYNARYVVDTNDTDANDTDTNDTDADIADIDDTNDTDDTDDTDDIADTDDTDDTDDIADTDDTDDTNDTDDTDADDVEQYIL